MNRALDWLQSTTVDSNLVWLVVLGGVVAIGLLKLVKLLLEVYFERSPRSDQSERLDRFHFGPQLVSDQRLNTIASDVAALKQKVNRQAIESREDRAQISDLREQLAECRRFISSLSERSAHGTPHMTTGQFRTDSSPASRAGVEERAGKDRIGRMVEQYNRDPQRFASLESSSKCFGPPERVVQGQVKSHAEPLRFVLKEAGEYLYLEIDGAGYAFPCWRNSYSDDTMAANGMHSVFPSKDYRDGGKYTRIKLTKPARFRIDFDGSLSLVEAGEAELICE